MKICYYLIVTKRQKDLNSSYRLPGCMADNLHQTQIMHEPDMDNIGNRITEPSDADGNIKPKITSDDIGNRITDPPIRDGNYDWS